MGREVTEVSTWAVGDIQGCWRTLQRLLVRIDYDATRDRLWLAGDLVNRGPANVAVLRWARAQGESVVAILGNHDLKLLTQAAGLAKPRRLDTLHDVLTAPDRDELIDWLRKRPLAHHEKGWLMVHAGISPGWSVDDTMSHAEEVGDALRRGSLVDALARLGDQAPGRWDRRLRGRRRLATIVATLCRLRACRADGTACLHFSGAPADAPAGCIPWFDVPGRRATDARIVFGHWSSLGLLVRDDVVCLDTGCVWGRTLSAIRLEDGSVVQEPCADSRTSAEESGE